MSQSVSTSQAAAKAAADAREALENAIAAVESEPDRMAALNAATQLADALRDVYEEATLLRARMITVIIDSGAMNQTELAERIGVSKMRISQLYRAGRGKPDA